MKKSFLVVLIGILAASTAWGATIAINATVTEKLEVSVGATSWAITLDNSGTAIQNDTQGAFTVKASKSNYTVTFSSANSGTLKNGTEAIPYKIKVDTSAWTEGVQINNIGTYTQLTTQSTIVFKKKTPTAGKTFNIGFNIEAYTEYYIDGAYTDTLSITISAT